MEILDYTTLENGWLNGTLEFMSDKIDLTNPLQYIDSSLLADQKIEYIRQN